jgi:hypothetical protein
MPGGLAVGLRRRKHAVLLALLVVALAAQTFNAQSGAERLGTDALRTVLVIATWIVVFERRRERATMGAVLLASLAIGWGRHFAVASLDHPLSLADHVVLVLFLWSAVYVILRDLFRARRAGAENVLGAICGYLIAGSAWSQINAIAYLLVPSAYSISPELASLLPDWHGRMALFTYYAFAQVMTIGYSDVTPIRAPATTLSLFAALFGVFYTAVVVSQFVGLAQKAKPETPTDQ